mmetsp:Transcript_14803/g.28185  ORF Transcript_14803/g.28185 Transcript_14803/m.28185 type:complete len:243 (+) Transcript_14803:1261-1989(+)|eukprot:scaffold2716_cov179-Amphora_coffeaeformis.AAC.15
MTSIGFKPAGAVMPSALGTCPAKMSAPTPVVNPAITETGTNLAITPTLDTPEANCNPPQASVINGNASNPCCWTAPTINKLIAAAGPVTASVVPPNRPPATPDTAAVTNPTSAGTPDANAMARFNGTATHPTVIPAEMSVRRVSRANIFRHSGHRDAIPRKSTLSGMMRRLGLGSASSSSSLLLLLLSGRMAAVVVLPLAAGILGVVVDLKRISGAASLCLMDLLLLCVMRWVLKFRRCGYR